MYLLKLFGSGKTLCVSKHSHSTMYLLKRYLCKSCICTVQKFTFHHVSIKTTIREMKGRFLNNSHSTMYLLKPYLPLQELFQVLDSHSTMYLLKHDEFLNLVSCLMHSHSTMYLLKRYHIVIAFTFHRKFTFHHVSIKTMLYRYTCPL